MTHRQEPERQPLQEPVRSARQVNLFERFGALLLLGFGVMPLVVGWGFLSRGDFDIRDFVGVTLIGIFAFAVIETFSIIIMWGLERLKIPDKFIYWLGGATVGEIAGLAVYVVAALFRTP